MAAVLFAMLLAVPELVSAQTSSGAVAGTVTANVASQTDSIAFGGVSENYKSLWFEGVDIGDEATGGGTNLSDSSRLNIPQDSGLRPADSAGVRQDGGGSAAGDRPQRLW